MRFLPKKWIIRCLLYYYQLTKKEKLLIWIFDFRREKIPAVSRNGPQVMVFVLNKRWSKMLSIAQLAELVNKKLINKLMESRLWDEILSGQTC